MEHVPFLSESIGIVIENHRQARGMTRSALADFAAMERRYLYGLVNATSNATVRTIYLLCHALNVSPVDFFSEVEAVRQKLKANALRKESESHSGPPYGERSD